MSPKRGRQLLGLSLLFLVSLAGLASAQPPSLDFGNLENAAPNLGGLGSEVKELKLSGSFAIQEGTRTGKLEVHAKAEQGWHTYSLTQKGGPGPSKLSVADSADYEVVGKFTADRKPHTAYVELDGTRIWDVPVEDFEEVVWSAPIKLAEGVKPQDLEIKVKYTGQVCSDTGGCIPIEDHTILASFAGYQEAGSSSVEFRAGNNSHVLIKGHVEPKIAAPGDTVKLVLTAIPDPPYHVYALADSDSGGASKPTLIALTESPGWNASQPVASKPVISDPDGDYYEGEVSWTIELKVPPQTASGDHRLAGIIGYQACIKNGACDIPVAAEFSTVVSIGEAQEAGQSLLSFEKASYASANKAAKSQPSTPGSAKQTELAEVPVTLLIAGILLLTFLGTFIVTGGIRQLSGISAAAVGLTLFLVATLILSTVHQLASAQTESTLWTALAAALAAWMIARLPQDSSVTRRAVTIVCALGIVVLIGASAFIGEQAIPAAALIGGGGLAIWSVMLIPSGAKMRRKVAGFSGAAVALLIAGGIAWTAQQSTELPWEPYSPELLEKYQEEGHIVLVDFTADW